MILYRVRFIFPLLLLFLLTTALLPFFSDATAGLYPFVKLLFSGICHGISDRCFHINGAALPLCARCFGIYSGLFLGSFLSLFLLHFDFQSKKLTQRRYLWLALTPIIVHKIVELVGLLSPSVGLAFTTGFVSGLLLFLYISNRFFNKFSGKFQIIRKVE
ncbi:MAG: DUF2085 domain-containing protein [Ignavibacteriaceae bacterium]|nr:MAG: DUF2085 domain-containing protein [Ignavibacteriaceae bacterium]